MSKKDNSKPKKEFPSKKKTGNPLGRPAYDVDELRIKIHYKAPKGLNDRDLCKFLGISEATYYQLKANNSDFSETIKFYRDLSTLDVLKSFKNIACGYSYDEVKKELRKNAEGKYELKVTEVITKHVTPNATAGIFYLKNRDPEHFKDKIETTLNLDGVMDHVTFMIKGKDK